MDGFSYVEGVMHAERVPLPAIAAAVGTPVNVEVDVLAKYTEKLLGGAR